MAAALESERPVSRQPWMGGFPFCVTSGSSYHLKVNRVRYIHCITALDNSLD